MSLTTDIDRMEFEQGVSARYGEDVTAGDTTAAQRRECMRELIIRRGEAHLPPKSTKTGRTSTLAERFQEVYGESLLPVDRHENGDGV